MNIFLLHRDGEPVCSQRIADLSHYGEVILCSDKESIKSGFSKLSSFKDFPEITSWDVAFSKLSENPKDSWFFENDVFWGDEALTTLFALQSRNEELISSHHNFPEQVPKWYWWQHYAHHFSKPARSFNPVCRLRESLVRKILEFRSHNDGFVFHELLFASLATSCFDLGHTELIGSAFRWRPKIEPHEMQSRVELFHPVKDA